MAAASGMNSAGLDVRCYLQREGGLAAVLRAKKVCGREGEFVAYRNSAPQVHGLSHSEFVFSLFCRRCFSKLFFREGPFSVLFACAPLSPHVLCCSSPPASPLSPRLHVAHVENQNRLRKMGIRLFSINILRKIRKITPFLFANKPVPEFALHVSTTRE